MKLLGLPTEVTMGTLAKTYRGSPLAHGSEPLSLTHASSIPGSSKHLNAVFFSTVELLS